MPLMESSSATSRSISSMSGPFSFIEMGNHFDAVAFGNAEVAIVARHGAEPLYFRKLAPRRTAQIAVRVSSGYQVEHDVEARIAEHAYIGGSCSMTSPIKRFASAMPSMTP